MFYFSNFLNGVPPHRPDEEICMEFVASRSGYWNDRDCSTLNGRVCKRPQGATYAPLNPTSTPTSTPTPTPQGHCGEGWIHVG